MLSHATNRVLAQIFKIPTEKTLAGHVSWIREMMKVGIVADIQ